MKKTAVKNPGSAIIRPDRSILNLCQRLEWEYTEVFMEGWDTRMKAIEGGEAIMFGMTVKNSTLDGVIQDIERRITDLKLLQIALKDVRKNQMNTAIRPSHDPEKEMEQIFRKLAFEKIEPNEITGYIKAYRTREKHSKPTNPVADDLLSTLASRANGESPIVEKLMKEEGRSNIVWNWLVDAEKRSVDV